MALLALTPGAVVSVDRLIDDLWGDQVPSDPANALQIVVFKLRRALGAPTVATRPPGYALAVEPDDVDAVRFERLVRAGREALSAGRREEALGAFDEALGLWRGDALAEFRDIATAAAAASRLDELRHAAQEDRFDALLDMGRDADLVADLESAIAASPFRERLRCQLMLALYRAGRQADALRAYANAHRLLADELGLEPGGELRRLEAAVLAQDPSLDLQPSPAGSVQVPARLAGNLVAPLTTFVGRDDDVAQVRRLIDHHRLVSLVGPGGSGKTRLATEAAGVLAPSYPGGVWFVALEGVSGPGGVAAAAAGALGLSSADAAGQPEIAASNKERLLSVLADRSALLVLDNCEHVIDDAARLASELLGGTIACHLLATSREALRVPGEVVWTVPPLTAEDAEALFIERAEALGADLDLSDRGRTTIAELCTRLDRMPLAIELTAARSNAFTVEQLLERLGDRFRLLTGGSRTVLPRQQTLRAVTDWSYELLFDDERTIFERLSVFAGGCTLEAAEEVCADDRLAHAEVGSLVGRLVDKSLLIADGTGRYRMLLTLAQYARERLVEHGGSDAVRDRHASYYGALAGRSFGDWTSVGGRNQQWWLATLTAELDNLRLALEWAISRGDATTAQVLAGRMGWYWWHAGRTVEGDRWCEQALALDVPTPPEIRLPAVSWAAFLAFGAGRSDVAATRVAEAIAIDAQTATTLPGFAHAVAAQVALTEGRVDDAIAHLDHGQRAQEAVGKPWYRGVAAGLRSRAAWLRGDRESARREIMDSIDRLRDAGDVGNLVLALDHLCVMLLADGNLDAAENAAAEARDVSVRFDLQGWRATMCTRLGALSSMRGDDERASSLFTEAAEIAHELALPVPEVAALDGLGTVHRRRGEFDAARRCHLASRRVAERFGKNASGGSTLTQLGYLAEQSGDLAEARRLHGEVVSVSRAAGDRRRLASGLDGLAAVAVAAGDPVSAAALAGCAASMRGPGPSTGPANDAGDLERTRRATLNALGEAEYHKAFDRGATTGIDEVLEAAHAALSHPLPMSSAAGNGTRSPRSRQECSAPGSSDR